MRRWTERARAALHKLRLQTEDETHEASADDRGRDGAGEDHDLGLAIGMIGVAIAAGIALWLVFQ